ncbi:hypothetical protein R2F25_20355 [Streptomyces sp. UP1A-1]|nr:hypothetical protein [Streptomyces sp. UP1A-1]
MTICRARSLSVAMRKASESQLVRGTSGRSWMATAVVGVRTSTAGVPVAGTGTAETSVVRGTTSVVAASGGQTVPPSTVASRPAKDPAIRPASATAVEARASVHHTGASLPVSPSRRDVSPGTCTRIGASTATRGRPSGARSWTTAPSARESTPRSGPPA